MARYEVTAWYAFVHESIKGMTAKEAAERAGIHPSAMSRWRNGLGAEPQIVVQYARAHKLSVVDALAASGLITEEEANAKVVKVPTDMSTVRLADLLSEVQGRLALLEEGLGIANSTAIRGDGAVGPEGAAGGQPDTDAARQGLPAGRDRTGPARLGDQVLDPGRDVAALPTGGPGPLVSRIDFAPEDELNVTPSPQDLDNRRMKTPKGRWAQAHIASLLGLEATSWSKLLNGLIYPARLQTMQKIEYVFGWPVSEQVQLIPPYWEWPAQAAGGKPPADPVDLRYAIKLSRVVAEWSDANPRTVAPKDITLHPAIRPINKQEGPRFGKPAKAEEPEPEEKPKEEERRFVPPARSPLLKR